MFRHQSCLLLAVCGVLGLTAVPARAENLPKGEEVVDQYIEAIGGKAAFDKLHNSVSEGTMAVGGIKGQLKLYQAAPNKSLLDVDLPGIGKITEGTDGETAWSNNAFTGARIKKGDERAQALRGATFNEAKWRDIYKSAKCEAEEDVDGKPCYKVKLTTPEGHVRTSWYDKKSHLLVKQASKETTPQGELEQESMISDYKKVDGVLVPHKLVQKASNQEIVMTLDKVQFNVDMPADRFALPDEIKKLKEKEDAKK